MKLASRTKKQQYNDQLHSVSKHKLQLWRQCIKNRFECNVWMECNVTWSIFNTVYNRIFLIQHIEINICSCLRCYMTACNPMTKYSPNAHCLRLVSISVASMLTCTFNWFWRSSRHIYRNRHVKQFSLLDEAKRHAVWKMIVQPV